MAVRHKTLVARTQFVAEIDGKTVVVIQGARVRADDPIVTGREALFAPVREEAKPKPRKR
jgi:hypothetical protein